MKKINFKLLTALLAVVLVAGVGIFYACKKEENLKKEAEFVAKINKETCVHVTIYRDKENNAHFVTKKTANDPNVPTGIIIPNEINTTPLNAKNGEEEIIIELSDDAIHWLVPLDGNEPEKASDKPKVSCSCKEGKPNCFENLHCHAQERQDKYGKYVVCVPSVGCCKTCESKLSVAGSTSTGYTLIMGSIYIVQSNTITVNGITYE
jgi:hypothetical protein